MRSLITILILFISVITNAQTTGKWSIAPNKLQIPRNQDTLYFYFESNGQAVIRSSKGIVIKPNNVSAITFDTLGNITVNNVNVDTLIFQDGTKQYSASGSSTETDPIWALDSAKVLHFSDTILKIATKNDLLSVSVDSSIYATRYFVYNNKILKSVATTTGETYGLVMDGDTIKKQLVPTPDGINGSIQLNYDNALYASPELSFDTTKMAFTAGYRTGTVGDNSAVFCGIDGYANTASGLNAFSAGNGNTSSGVASTTFGSTNTASGNLSFAMGSNVTAHDFTETAIGHYSTTSTGSAETFLPTNTAFKIGNGTSGSPSDCFKVDFSGNTTITGNAIVEDNIKTNYIEPLTTNDALSIGHSYVGFNGATATDHLTLFTKNTTDYGITLYGYSSTNTDYPQIGFGRSLSDTYNYKVRTIAGTILGQLNFKSINSSNAEINSAQLRFIQLASNATNTPVRMQYIASRLTSLSPSIRFMVTEGGQIAIAGSTAISSTATSPSYSFSMFSGASQSIGVEASGTTAVGSNLSINAGGTSAGGTDNLDGGMLTLSPGISKSQGKASLRLQGNTRASASGTVLNELVDRVIIPSEFNLTDAGNNDLFEVALPTLNATGGTINFSINVGDGTNVQTYTGIVIYSAVNKGGTYTTTINESVANSALSTGTLTTAWSVVNGTNKITIRVVPTSSLTPTSMKISYTLINQGATAVTQL